MPALTSSVGKLLTDRRKFEENRVATSAPILHRLGLERFLRADWFRCLFLALVGVIVRLPALQGQFIWDDQYLIRNNPFIKTPLLILESFRHYLFLDS
jgi:hypothetical protein